jgi:hypothetical protein
MIKHWLVLLFASLGLGISGCGDSGLLQGAEFLNETGAGIKTVVIFSDMQEELDQVTIRDVPMNLKNIRVVAVNFGRLEACVPFEGGRRTDSCNREST